MSQNGTVIESLFNFIICLRNREIVCDIHFELSQIGHSFSKESFKSKPTAYILSLITYYKASVLKRWLV
jgi:hypothetical protein